MLTSKALLILFLILMLIVGGASLLIHYILSEREYVFYVPEDDRIFISNNRLIVSQIVPTKKGPVVKKAVYIGRFD